MRRAQFFCGLSAVLVLGPFAASASADPTAGPPICRGNETAIDGNYGNLVITGNRYVGKKTTLNGTGNLTIGRGACLDAFTLGTVHVTVNVNVEKGAILALGCTPGSIGPVPSCNNDTTPDTV